MMLTNLIESPNQMKNTAGNEASSGKRCANFGLLTTIG
jgi:hypothetical protein